MKPIKECRFCNILRGIYKYKDIDTPLIETDKYAMIPSVGAFIPGWSLIVSKEHGYSMQKFYSDKELFSFFDSVKHLVEKTYNKKLIAFEHGANKEDSLTSCGTCHSHLHIIPFNESIYNDINSERDWISCKFSEIDGIVQDNEYLLYVEISDDIENSKCYLHILKEEISQYFRKILAEHINYKKDYSYKTNLLLEDTLKTVEKYRKELQQQNYGK